MLSLLVVTAEFSRMLGSELDSQLIISRKATAEQLRRAELVTSGKAKPVPLKFTQQNTPR